MSTLKTQLESLLLVSNYPLTLRKLADLTEAKLDAVRKAADELEADYQQRTGSGLRLLRSGEELQLATAGESAAVVQKFLKDETTGELTRASLEALTIVAYRGPVARAEIEHIRGVNCAIILRNLMVRGLVESHEDRKAMVTTYHVTVDFLKFLGISHVRELPDYERLNSAEALQRMLAEAGSVKQGIGSTE